MDRAIIAAAGWKGIGWQAGLAKFPAPFLPLGDGSTPLGRISTQLSRLGFQVYIGLGKRGYPFRAYRPHSVHGLVDGELKTIQSVLEMMKLDPESSPWTQELYDYAGQFGTVIEIGDPGWKSKHDTFCTVMDEIGLGGDRLVLARGNTLLTSSLLGEIVNLRWPGQYQIYPNHSIFLLSRQAVITYREYAEGYRNGWKTMAERNPVMEMYPDGQIGTGELTHHGIAHFGPHLDIGSEKDWKEVSDTNKLVEARRAIRMGEFDSVPLRDGLRELGTLDSMSTSTSMEKALLGISYDPAIYDENWYRGQDWQHNWCQKLMGWLAGEFGPFESSLDLGAGDGYYSLVLREMGTEAVAVELHEIALDVFPEGVVGVAHDLREPLDFHRRYDLVICLEVAEHLPEENADTLCDTIAAHCGRMLLFTAAPPGQGGHGHVNLQPFEYWADRLASRGVRYNEAKSDKTKVAWKNILGGSMPWLPKNVTIFERV